MIPAPPTIRSTRSLAAAVAILLAVQVVLILIHAGTLASRLAVLHRYESGGFVTQAQADSADRAVSGAAGIEFLVLLATAVVWCVWQYRAQRNAASLAAGGTRFTPGWAVGWWFIPFANLVMPFQTIRELWKASHGGGDDWRTMKTWPVIGSWWAFWIAGNLSLWIGGGAINFGFEFGSSDSAKTVPQLIAHDTWAIVWLGARVVAAILAIVIVRSIAPLQEAAAPTAPSIPDAPASSIPEPPPPPI